MEGEHILPVLYYQFLFVVQIFSELLLLVHLVMCSLYIDIINVWCKGHLGIKGQTWDGGLFIESLLFVRYITGWVLNSCVSCE